MIVIWPKRCRLLACSTMAVAAAIAPIAVQAQTQTFQFDIPPQSLDGALRAFARTTRQQVLFDGALVRGKRSPALIGHYTAEAGIGALLAGSGVAATRGAEGVYVIKASAPGEADAGRAPANGESAEILVTGSRIKGAASPSPLTEVTSQDIRKSGFNSLGQVIRSLPQNFSGGQNPGLGINAGGIADQNVSGGSALDLRGLGPDDTLTLLNGRRLAYDGFGQGIDISAIPIAAVDRLEIVTDGASAIYGSDAVAGVANVILKTDYSGLTTTALIGGATDGGLVTKGLNVTAGRTWQSGNLLLAYDFQHAGNIRSTQRSYLGYLDDRLDVYPALEHNSVILSGRQALTGGLSLSLDALYSTRLQHVQETYFDQLDTKRTRARTVAVTPSINVALPDTWSATITGTYSKNSTHIRETDDSGGYALCLCDSLKAAEVNAEGALLSLPGGNIRAALGIGYRSSGLTASLGNPALTLTNKYGFAELNIPLVSPDLAIPGIHRLSITAAGRYEDYRSVGTVGTPKLGIIYEPVTALTIKGTWGKSFKAPTIEQLRTTPYVYLYNATDAGGVGYPANATVLIPDGRADVLKPERATSWTSTIEFHPASIAGLKIEATYFNVHYRDRIIQPIDDLSIALQSSRYDRFITLNPSSVLLTSILAKPGVVFYNGTAAAYDPANVVAVIDGDYTNVARQKMSGVDLSGSYATALWNGQAEFDASASWLKGNQVSARGGIPFSIVGRGGRPAKFRSRAGASWTGDRLSLASYINVVGSVYEDRFVPNGRTGSFTTVDATIRYRIGTQRSGLELALAAQNLLNTAPPIRAVPYDFVLNYDSTNYSAIGRFVSFSVTKAW